MTEKADMMDKFEFLIGKWNLEYMVPKSVYSEAAAGSGTGTFKRALEGRFVFFDYSASLNTGQGKGQAHGVFGWDEKNNGYRYWWFESSGTFMTATCNFIDDDTLFISWHEMLMLQTFTRIDPDKVILSMGHPIAGAKFEPILEVIFTKR